MSNLNQKQIYTLLGVFLAAIVFILVAFEYYHQRSQHKMLEQQQTQNVAHIEMLRAQSNKLSAQANRLSEESEALKRQVDEEHLAAEKLKQDFAQAGALSEGLRSGISVKVAIADFYLEQGKFPKRNSDIGLGAPETFQDNALKSLEVTDGGIITLTYDQKTGIEDGKIFLIPQMKNQGVINWKCETNSYENIAKIVPTCSYTSHVES